MAINDTIKTKISEFINSIPYSDVLKLAYTIRAQYSDKALTNTHNLTVFKEKTLELEYIEDDIDNIAQREEKTDFLILQLLYCMSKLDLKDGIKVLYQNVNHDDVDEGDSIEDYVNVESAKNVELLENIQDEHSFKSLLKEKDEDLDKYDILNRDPYLSETLSDDDFMRDDDDI